MLLVCCCSPCAQIQITRELMNEEHMLEQSGATQPTTGAGTSAVVSNSSFILSSLSGPRTYPLPFELQEQKS
mgnify:FL=1